MSEQIYVEIVKRAVLHRNSVRGVTEQVVKRMGPLSPSRADKVMAGVNINLNHEQYFVRQVSK